jgi:hypothetical protein
MLTAVHNNPELERLGSVPRMAGRRYSVEQLVGAAEIAQRLGAAGPRVIHEWRRRHSDFPDPVLTLKQAMVWNWPDVEKWAKATGRL